MTKYIVEVDDSTEEALEEFLKCKPIKSIAGYNESAQQWIPVSERLPKAEGYGHYFLCCLENNVVRIQGYSNTQSIRCPKGFYYEENGFTWRQDRNPVVAWMELPKPYERKE